MRFTNQVLYIIITNDNYHNFRFFWQFKDDDSDIVSIVPSSGTLTSQESIEIIFKFTPQEEKHYSLKGLITTFFKDCNIEKSSQRNKTIVMLAGKGTSGKINVSYNLLYINLHQCSVQFLMLIVAQLQ